MAKRKRARRASKAAAPKHMLSHPKYAGKQFDCYGKHVRTKKGGPKNSARVYCGRAA